jgi:hypothetical protein
MKTSNTAADRESSVDRNLALIRAELARIVAQKPHLKETLEWEDVFELLHRDGAGRWDVSDDTPSFIADYCRQFRTPSRAWPQSRAKALFTKKAARHIIKEDLLLALNFNLTEAFSKGLKETLMEASPQVDPA